MKICITGGTGFLGTRITEFFLQSGYSVENISREDIKKPIENWSCKINGAEVLINLAGAPIIKKWTPSYKETIKSSRIQTTKKLVEALRSVEEKPKVVLSASAVGIYDDVEIHDEFSDNLSSDFLADVCKEWEAAAAPMSGLVERFAIIRLGIVLDKKGGALAQMLPMFKLGLGAIIGDGNQPFPCIHIDDFLTAIWYIIKNPDSNGVYNLVAPEMISNKYFSKVLARELHRPLLFKIPNWMMKFLYGEGALVLIKGQKVKPMRLLELNFPYQYATVDAMLKDIVK